MTPLFSTRQRHHGLTPAVFTFMSDHISLREPMANNMPRRRTTNPFFVILSGFWVLGLGMTFFAYVYALQNFMLPRYTPLQSLTLAAGGIIGVGIGGGLLGTGLALALRQVQPSFTRHQGWQLVRSWALGYAALQVVATLLAYTFELNEFRTLLARTFELNEFRGVSSSTSALVSIMPLLFALLGAWTAASTLEQQRQAHPVPQAHLIRRADRWKLIAVWTLTIPGVPVLAAALLSAMFPDQGLGLVAILVMISPVLLIVIAVICGVTLRHFMRHAQAD
jgi:hypothetical protein